MKQTSGPRTGSYVRVGEPGTCKGNDGTGLDPELSLQLGCSACATAGWGVGGTT